MRILKKFRSIFFTPQIPTNKIQRIQEESKAARELMGKKIDNIYATLNGSSEEWFLISKSEADEKFCFLRGNHD